MSAAGGHGYRLLQLGHWTGQREDEHGFGACARRFLCSLWPCRWLLGCLRAVGGAPKT